MATASWNSACRAHGAPRPMRRERRSAERALRPKRTLGSPLRDVGNKCGTSPRFCQENVVHLAIVVNERLARFCRRPICPMYPRRRRLLGKATLEAPGSSRHFQCRDGVDLLSQLLLYSHAAGGHQGHDGAAGEEARSLKREGRVNGHGRGGERTLWRQKVTVSRTVKTVVRSDAT